MAEALLGAMEHSASLAATKEGSSGSGGGGQVRDEVLEFTKTLRTALHNTFRYGQGTRDMAGPDGLTTEQVGLG
jgi:isocitrate dehydrogenase